MRGGTKVWVCRNRSGAGYMVIFGRRKPVMDENGFWMSNPDDAFGETVAVFCRDSFERFTHFYLKPGEAKKVSFAVLS